jgi:hypothetical protein
MYPCFNSTGPPSCAIVCRRGQERARQVARRSPSKRSGRAPDPSGRLRSLQAHRWQPAAKSAPTHSAQSKEHRSPHRAATGRVKSRGMFLFFTFAFPKAADGVPSRSAGSALRAPRVGSGPLCACECIRDAHTAACCGSRLEEVRPWPRPSLRALALSDGRWRAAGDGGCAGRQDRG